MAYFKPNIDADGIHVPTYADIMEYLQGEYRGIFGQDAYLGEETQDYQLLSVFAKCMDDYGALVVDAYNARNPNYATGNSLDLLLPLIGASRRAPTESVALLALTGAANAEVPKGSLAIDAAGYIWATDADVTLDANGDGSVSATCTTPGPIIAQAGTINGIYTPVVGWFSVTNAGAATPGLDAESDAEVRERMARTAAAEGESMYDSILGALKNITYVTFAKLYRNDTDTTDANGIPGHSIAAVCVGGSNRNIARALFTKKAIGIGTYGSLSYTLKDDYGNSNVIYFSQATFVTVALDIRLKKLTGYDESIETLIKDFVYEFVNSKDIGEEFLIMQLYGVIMAAAGSQAGTFYIDQILWSYTGRVDDIPIVRPAWNQKVNTYKTMISITAST